MSVILTNSLKNLPKMKIINTNYNVSRMSSAWSSGLSTYQAFRLRENIGSAFKPEESRQFGTVLHGMATDTSKYSASQREMFEHLITKKPSVIEVNPNLIIEIGPVLDNSFPKKWCDEYILNFNQYAQYDDTHECRESGNAYADNNYHQYENYSDRED